MCTLICSRLATYCSEEAGQELPMGFQEWLFQLNPNFSNQQAPQEPNAASGTEGY